MKSYRILPTLLIGAFLFACSPQAQPISPPPYPPPVTPSPPMPMGSVTGKVMLQGRMNHQGIAITIGQLPPATTNAEGSYAVLGSVPKGQHVIKAEKTGYLRAMGHVEIRDDATTETMPPVTLLAGDLNGDDAINLFDLVLISALFGNQDTESLLSDLNADGAVNLFDLVLVGNNLDKSGPIPFE